MKMLYENRSNEDKAFITKVCNYIFSHPLERKPVSNKFVAIYVEGRNRSINTLEDFASIYSFKALSACDYPVIVFCRSNLDWMDGDYATLSRVTFVEIPELNNLEEYSNFCTEKLYFLLPEFAENIITLQPDGMILRSGYEDWILKNDFDIIGPHIRHFAAIDVRLGLNNDWIECFYPPINRCNLGFSYRKASKMRDISNKFRGIFRERFAPNNKKPQEDLYFSYYGFGSGICKQPTLAECDLWAVDPLDEEIFDNGIRNNNLPFGFHFLKQKSEWPKCNHG